MTQPYRAPQALLRPPFRTPQVTGVLPGGDALIKSVCVHYYLTDTGYLTSVSVQYSSPTSPGHNPKVTTVPDYEVRTWEPFTSRPSLRALLQSAARRVWAMSTGPVVRRYEGEDPLPGL